jgi:hypothetical protein
MPRSNCRDQSPLYASLHPRHTVHPERTDARVKLCRMNTANIQFIIVDGHKKAGY